MKDLLYNKISTHSYEEEDYEKKANNVNLIR